MKYLAVVALTAVICSFAGALHLEPRSSQPRVVSAPTERRRISNALSHERSRWQRQWRRGTVEQTLDNEQSLYYANISLGTPGQALRLHLDTGSSDLWVNTAGSALCSSRGNPCEGGTYDSGASSTYKFVNSDFNISYVDGSAAQGDYGSDVLQFGGVRLSNFQFGIGQVSTSLQGVLGIGYASNEVQVIRAGLAPYPNLPEALENAGLTASNAYSLWLNDLDASTGEILFGGVNTAKYQGELATLPVLHTYGGYYELTIALTGVTFAGTDLSSSSSFPTGVLLDSGATLTYLPNDIVTDIYNQVRAVYDSSVGAAYAMCDLASTSSTMDFDFSGQIIRVPLDELLLDAGTTQNGAPLTFDNGARACIFGIAPAQSGSLVLGDTFLRSAYVVYDLANNEISLAQTVFNSTADDIQEITQGPDSVPNAHTVSNPVSNINGATGGGRLGGGATASVTGGFSTPSGTTNDGGASTRRPSLSLTAVLCAVLCAVAVAASSP